MSLESPFGQDDPRIVFLILLGITAVTIVMTSGVILSILWVIDRFGGGRRRYERGSAGEEGLEAVWGEVRKGNYKGGETINRR